MAKHIAKWQPVICKTVRGNDFASGLPDLIAKSYKGHFLTQIQQMPRRNPISFENAIRIVDETSFKAFQQGNINLYLWYQRNFIQYISDLDFHIELTGDEFEIPVCSDRTA